MANKKTSLPVITKRSLFTEGGSLAITIPKEWLDAHGLKEGDELALIGNSDLSIKRMTEEVAKELHKKLEK